MSKTLFSIIEWENFQNFIFKKLNIKFKNLDLLLETLGKSDIIFDIYKIQDWEDLDDKDIYELSFKNFKISEGDVYILTEASYNQKYGPFKVNTKNLSSFIDNHLREFGECFYNLDVIMFKFCEKSKCINITFFHHEGVYSSKTFKI